MNSAVNITTGEQYSLFNAPASLSPDEKSAPLEQNYGNQNT